MDELCALLLVGATFSSDVVTLRERLELNFQMELDSSRVADGREQQLLGAKAIDGGELGCNEVAVINCDPRLRFIQKDHQKRPSKR